MGERTIDTAWFQSLIKDKGYSQRGFARLIEMDHAALSLMLNGKRKMSVGEAGTLARLLDKPVAEILRRAGVEVRAGEPEPVLTPATDPGRAAEEMEALIQRLRSWGENDPDETYFQGDALACLLIDCGKASEVIAQLQADLIAARKERDEATRLLRVLNEETVLAGYPCGDRDRTLANVRALRSDLIALAKMHGEACRDLVYARSGEDDLFWQKEEAVVALSRKLVAAEEEAAQLRARLHEAEKGAVAMRDALDQAEACLSIVASRSDKAEYLRTLGVVRAALATKSAPPLNRSETDGGRS